MISPAVRPFAIALLFAAVVLAVLLAHEVFNPASVGAHDCDPNVESDAHEDFHETVCDQSGHDKPHENVIEVDGGRDNEMVFRVFPPSDRVSYLGADDQIEITLKDFRLPRGEFDLDGRERVEISGSNEPESPAPLHPKYAVVMDEAPDTLLLTIPDLTMRIDDGEHLIITIKEGTGIMAPKTPQGFHDPTQDDEGYAYKVGIKFLDAAGGTSLGDVDAQDENFVVVKNPLSSTEPGATVRIDLATHANVTIGSNEEIAVDFSGPSDDTHFILPSTISTSRIKIRPSEGAAAFDPADVLVQGERVILTVPDAKTVPTGDFVISFSQLARIKNPFVAGNRVITVSSFESGFRDDEITAVIRRSTTIDPSEGPRGTEFTLKGKGYQKGTVAIFEGANRVVDAGETLTSVKTSKGAFSLKLNARGDYGTEKYTVHTIDSYGVYDSVDFDITSSVLFEPAVANVGSMLRMTIYDWEDRAKTIAAVRIAGQEAFVADVQRAGECFNHFGEIGADPNGTVILEVEVPDGVPPGEQTVSVYDREQLEYIEVIDGKEMEFTGSDDCRNGAGNGVTVRGSGKYTATIGDDPNAEATATIEIESEGLVISPSTAARGQRVTITGSGFTRAARGSDFFEVAIDGWLVPEGPSFFEVGTNGNFALTVTVPLEVRNGGVELRVEGWDHTVAQVELTIAEPSLTVDPEESGRGTKVDVSGSGFVAGRAVTLRYGDGVAFGSGDEIIGVAVADAGGGISATFEVPYSAAIGRTHKVTAVSLADDSLPLVLQPH